MPDVLDMLAESEPLTLQETAPGEINTESDPPSQQQVPADWIRDRDTGEMRPRKRRGRKPVNPPPLDHQPIDREPDMAPDAGARGKSKRTAGVPRYKAGAIAKGMTKVYQRTGRIVRAWDKGIGSAIIASAEDCGEAWDELAKQNPRVRAVLMKMVSGSAWGNIIMAHLPIVLAMLVKERIRKRLPFGNLIASMAETDDDGENDLGGMSADDVQQAMTLASGLFSQMMPGTP